jgi:hypothetical protein
MLHINCPNCGRKLRVNETMPAAQCPACRTKFKVALPEDKAAAVPAQAVPARHAVTSDEMVTKRLVEPVGSMPREMVQEEVLEVEPVQEPEKAPQHLSRTKPPSEIEPGAPNETEESSEDHPDTSRRRKKKRRKPKESLSSEGAIRLTANLLVAGAMLCVGLAVVGAFALYKLSGLSISNRPDPEAERKAAAELENLGAFVERDNTSPEKRVIVIMANRADITGKTAVYLESFPKLRKLDLSGTKFNNVDLLHLQGLTELRELYLGNTRVGDDVEPLGKLVNLEVLDLSNTLVRDTGLHHLRGLTRLKRLSLSGSLASGIELQLFVPGLQVSR